MNIMDLLKKEVYKKQENLEILEDFWSYNGGASGLILARDKATKNLKIFFGSCELCEDKEKNINYICNMGLKLEEPLLSDILLCKFQVLLQSQFFNLIIFPH